MLDTSNSAFDAFLQRKLLKALPSPVDLPSPNASGVEHFDAILAKDAADAEWARVAREKEEKFSMYLTSLSKASAAIRTAAQRVNGSEGGQEGVKELVEGAADVLGPYLGETVRAKDMLRFGADDSSATR